MPTLRSLRAMPLDIFCLDKDSRFFSDPFQPAGPAEAGWSLDLPADWRKHATLQWTYATPPSAMADQGWKLHLSATPGSARTILQAAADFCVGHGVHFKYLSSPTVLELANSKYAARHASGKFITIYPDDERQLEQALETLDAAVGGLPGPYILSDHRWKRGPLHLRYGAFRHLPIRDQMGHDGSGLRAPDGEMVLDRREPYFALPDWAPVPRALAESLSTSEDAVESPYEFTEALHFSNGGGVYRGIERSTGRIHVLKEGRPHAGLDGLQVDATQRLEREATALRALAGLPSIPALHGQFTLWEHSFLAIEQLPGQNLRSWIARNCPDVRPGTNATKRAAYARQCQLILERLHQLVLQVHQRGWIHGDIHPNNIMVDDDLNVFLLDFEQSCPVEQPHRPGLGAPGFTRMRHGGQLLEQADDLYGLAAVGLWFFTPLVLMLPHRPELAAGLVAEATERFMLEPRWSRFIGERLEYEATRRRGSLTDGRTREPERARDRQWTRGQCLLGLNSWLQQAPSQAGQPAIFPGDVHQILSDPANLSSGDAGPLYALQAAGESIPSWALDRLEANARRLKLPGLLCGLAGPALVLQRSGRGASAHHLICQAARESRELPDITMATGRAGLIVALLSEDFAHLGWTVSLARELATGLAAGKVYPAATATGNAAGLAEGYAGAAVACARLAAATGERQWLDTGMELLDRDLANTELSQGMRLVNEDGILYPYLAHGSAGLAVAHGELQAVGGQPDATVFGELLGALDVASTVEAGMYDGATGLAAALVHLRVLGVEVPTQLIQRHLTAAADFAVQAPHGGSGLAGRGLRTLSFDFSTGTSGWLLTDLAVEQGRSPLPALNPIPTTHRMASDA